MKKKYFYTEEEAAARLTPERLQELVQNRMLRTFIDGPKKMFAIAEVEAFCEPPAQENDDIQTSEESLAGEPAADSGEEAVPQAEITQNAIQKTRRNPAAKQESNYRKLPDNETLATMFTKMRNGDIAEPLDFVETARMIRDTIRQGLPHRSPIKALFLDNLPKKITKENMMAVVSEHSESIIGSVVLSQGETKTLYLLIKRSVR